MTNPPPSTELEELLMELKAMKLALGLSPEEIETYITEAKSKIQELITKHTQEALNEKTPEGADSYSLRLNTLDYSTVFDTLKDYALKLVANAHSEMSGEQWEEWLNEHTNQYAKALSQEGK